MTFDDAGLLAAAGLIAGAVNAAAGGGSLITFPALMLTGLPALTANVTNTVALSFGYAGGASGFRHELAADTSRARRLALCAGVGAVLGVVLLQLSSPDVFEGVVPWLLLFACVLLGVQPAIARRLSSADETSARRARFTDITQAAAGTYGAYFGAGYGVMILALLGLTGRESLHELNAIKSALTLVVNVIAAVCFAIIAPVAWSAVACLGPASLVGGRLGAALSKRVPSERIRFVVVVVGVTVALMMLLG